MMSLAKLTSLSTQTLSLLLERQRVQTLPSFSSTSLHLSQITRNLNQLQIGILELEAKEGRSEAVNLLWNQYKRMRNILGDEGSLESLVAEVNEASSSQLPPIVSFVSPAKDTEPILSPYTDEPDPGTMLQTQRQIIDEQDEQLHKLSHSINRQHHISLQINDEMDVHTGLLEELDTNLNHTGSKLSAARRRLDRVTHGAKENSSIVIIGLLILVLLVLIIVFKTRANF